MALPGRREAAVPAPVPERLPVAVPHPRLQRHPRCRGLADRQRGRIPRRAGQPLGRPRRTPPDGARGAGRPHRRLHARAGGELRPRQRRSRRAVRRRSARCRLPGRRPRIDRAGARVPGRPRRRARPHDASRVPRAAAHHTAAARDAASSARPHREVGGSGHDASGEPVEGPVEALLGGVIDGVLVERLWMDPVSENPEVGATEVWEFVNTTGDAHPMHVHEVAFEVVNREGLVLADDDEIAVPIQLDGSSHPPSHGRRASRTPSSPTLPRSPGCGRGSTTRASTSGTATSSSTRTTR